MNSVVIRAGNKATHNLFTVQRSCKYFSFGFALDSVHLAFTCRRWNPVYARSTLNVNQSRLWDVGIAARRLPLMDDNGLEAEAMMGVFFPIFIKFRLMNRRGNRGTTDPAGYWINESLSDTRSDDNPNLNEKSNHMIERIEQWPPPKKKTKLIVTGI